ncbi:MAG: glycosyltransferase family 2 protein [Dehalococcoidales bacterium]|nr:glycosyltransferase family 2 protein [Dehalococcoidales bacterium]
MEQSTKQDSARVAAAIPAFNEEEYIGTIVLKTRQYVNEVIVVDDGSTDQTAKVARLAGATVVQHPRNKGYGASIQTLLAEAKKKDINILVLLDADSQHNPDEIPELIKPIAEGFDLVIGSREHQAANIPLYRRTGQKVISYFSAILSGKKLYDSESGFRVFSKKAIASLELRENGMSASAETIAEAAEKGLKITEIPISIKYTRDSSTLNPIVHGLQVLGGIIIMISEKRPLFFFGLGGILLIILGLLAGIMALIIVFEGGGAVTGYALVSLLLLVIGVISVVTGIILNVLISWKG